jgi:hypothetical protein
MELFEAFKREFTAHGYADPCEYLADLEGIQRAELLGLIDAYLDRAPAGAIDNVAYPTSAAAQVVDALDQVAAQPAGMLPIVLPRLRRRANLRRAELAKRLASELGLGGKEKRIEEAYHELETGQLDSAGLTRSLLEALGKILGESADVLREFGRHLGRPSATPAPPAVAFGRQAPRATGPPRTPTSEGDEWDEVDELFRGGGQRRQ